MNASSPFDRSPHSQIAEPMIQQPDRGSFFQSKGFVDSLSGSLFPSLMTYMGIAVIFFFTGIGFGRRNKRRQERRARRKQQIQTLERIWQISAESKD